MIETLAVNFPTCLTLTRLFLSPLIMPFLLITFATHDNLWLNIFLAFIFLLFSLTDFFDGYLARHLRQETSLGKVLDPIADKFLVYSTLIGLVQTHKLYYFWPIIIIGREFFVMGIREVALYHGFNVAVSKTGKLKTVIQVLFLSFVILNPAQNIHNAYIWNTTETILLAATLFMTIYSAILYSRDFLKQWNVVKL